MADSKVGVSYCGLYCSGCNLHASNHTKKEDQKQTGDITETSPNLEEEIPWVSKLKSHLIRLGQSTPSCPGCKEGGGTKDCEVRTCATDRGYSTCLDCLRVATCRHLERRPWAQPSLDEIRDVGFQKWLKTKEDLVNNGWTYFHL
ncbi:MAG: DUF3795 domain-containing protein [Candidatus Thorarchaeota archaeon]|nr:DUF3795 domain-containing protein [Candidatus Thorarchaeota archaeon]